MMEKVEIAIRPQIIKWGQWVHIPYHASGFILSFLHKSSHKTETAKDNSAGGRHRYLCRHTRWNTWCRVQRSYPLKQDASSIMDWSIDIQTLDQIATELTCSIAQPRTVKLKLESGPLIFIQNLIFLSVVLIHGLRRHFPPY